MGEVVQFPVSDEAPHFCISVVWDENRWNIDVIDFHNKALPTHTMFREIAEALIPIAGGLTHQAEALEPTEKGCIVSNVSFYSSGVIEFQTQPLNTAKRKAWFLAALDTLRKNVDRKKRKAKT